MSGSGALRDLSTQWPLLIVGLAGVALAAVAVAIALLAKEPRSPLAWGVGATAGLQTAQVVNVHAFCFATAAWVLFGVLRHRRGQARLVWPFLIVTAAGILASTALTGSMVNSQVTSIQLVVLAATAACVAAFADWEDIVAALRGLLAITSVACVAAVLQYIHVLPYAVYLGTRRPIGIYSEPDWMGMFAAVGLVLAYRAGKGSWRTPLILLHILALLLSAARAAWLAVVVVLVLGWLAAKITGRPEKVERLPGGPWAVAAVALAVVLTIVVNPSLGEALQSRLEGSSASRPDVSAMARLQQNNSLLKLESQAPWNGLGLTASGRVGVSGRITTLGTADSNVASNWLLGWWVDGGLLALGMILIFLWAACCRLSSTPGMLLTVVLVSSIFSNAMFIPISWFLLGICLARAELVTEVENGSSRTLSDRGRKQDRPVASA